MKNPNHSRKVMLAVSWLVLYIEDMLWRSKKSTNKVAMSSDGFSVVGGSEPTPHGGLAGIHEDVTLNAWPASDALSVIPAVERSDVPLSQMETQSGAYIVPKGYRIAGAVVSHRPILLKGELHGRGVSAGDVVVESSGVLRAPADVENLRVFGIVQAPVRATTMVEVMPGGDVQGDIKTPACRVSPGGRISGGQLVIGVNGK